MVIGAALGVGSAVAGLFGSNKRNKAAKMDAETNRKLAEEQIAISRLIQQAAQQYAAQGNNVTDIYGGGARYNPVTGSWEYTLGDVPMAIQNASDEEELNRYTFDQGLRREGLVDSEIARREAGAEAGIELDQYARQRQGIGLVDPSQIAAQLRLNRRGAVNAGYDEAMKAAGTMSLRTGSAAGDTFAALGRARANDIARSMGDPEIEGLSIAESVNAGRRNNTLGAYNLFDTKGRDFYDAGYGPSGRASEAMDNNFRAKGMELEKFGATTGALGGAVAGMGSAGAGMRASQKQYMEQWNPYAGAQFLGSLGDFAKSKGW